MKRDLPALAHTTFDVLVIGGGIIGAGVARDAALRGLRVALVDQADFASGTSSRSTKMIHGGFRYLEQYRFGLVAEACRERHLLRQLAPHLVRPVPLLLPVYADDTRPFWMVRLGMTLYDVLARYRNVQAHQTLSAAEVAEREPQLDQRGLRGAVLFYDCQEDDARLCLDNVWEAAERGAVVANYCAVTGFVREGDRIVAAEVKDRRQDAEFTIRAKTFVNAAGPWVSGVAALADGPRNPVALSPSKGAHLLLPSLTNGHGVFLQTPQDHRLLFIVPWGDCSLVGTTDTDFRDTPDAVTTDLADVDYLLAGIRRLVPAATLNRDAVITAFAGVRPLMQATAQTPSTRTREHRLIPQGPNLLHVVGGKYTTYRLIAEQAVDRAVQMHGGRFRSCATAITPLPEHRPPPTGDQLGEVPAVFTSDVTYACDAEMAMTLTDVLWRRTGLSLSRWGGREVAERVAAVMGGRLGWTTAQQAQQVADYLRDCRPRFS